MTNDITIKSGHTVHVTIDDDAGAPLPPDAITYAIPTALVGQLTVAADATGFNLTASAGASAVATAMTFTYAGGGVTRTIDFSITLGEAAASLGFTSP
jgi:hypothetical protein